MFDVICCNNWVGYCFEMYIKNTNLGVVRGFNQDLFFLSLLV